jgi:hypothetical protein
VCGFKGKADFGYTSFMTITLTAHGEELLREALTRRPQQSPSEVIEDALAQQIEAEVPLPLPRPEQLTAEQFDQFLKDFGRFSDKIPPMPGETFPREMIYEDHN